MTTDNIAYIQQQKYSSLNNVLNNILNNLLNNVFNNIRKTIDYLTIITLDFFFLGMLKYLLYGYPNANY